MYVRGNVWGALSARCIPTYIEHVKCHYTQLVLEWLRERINLQRLSLGSHPRFASVVWLAVASSCSNRIPLSPQSPSATRSGSPPMARPI